MMIILKLNWLLHQTETEITYQDKLISDIFWAIDRGNDLRNEIWNEMWHLLKGARLQNWKQNQVLWQTTTGSADLSSENDAACTVPNQLKKKKKNVNSKRTDCFHFHILLWHFSLCLTLMHVSGMFCLMTMAAAKLCLYLGVPYLWIFFQLWARFPAVCLITSCCCCWSVALHPQKL